MSKKRKKSLATKKSKGKAEAKPRKLLVVDIPEYQVFFDGAGSFIETVSDSDGIIGLEHDTVLQHFGVEVRELDLPEKLKEKVDAELQKYDREHVIRTHIRPFVQKWLAKNS